MAKQVFRSLLLWLVVPALAVPPVIARAKRSTSPSRIVLATYNVSNDFLPDVRVLTGTLHNSGIQFTNFTLHDDQFGPLEAHEITALAYDSASDKIYAEAHYNASYHALFACSSDGSKQRAILKTNDTHYGGLTIASVRDSAQR